MPHVSALCSFSLANYILVSGFLSGVYPFTSSWLYSDCFQLLVIMNKTAVNNSMFVCAWTDAFVSLGPIFWVLW